MSARTMDFPSILDLGRLAGAVSRRSATYDTVHGCTDREATTGGGLCLDLTENLQRIIASRRAATLGDVATQLAIAFTVVDWLDSADAPEHEVQQNLKLLRRIVLSALPVVAAAADIDLAELDADYLLGYADLEFPPVLAPSPDDGGGVGFGRASA
jgi:hypothetical protein